MRTIAVATVARSDYGIYLSVLRAIQQNRDLELVLIAAAAHLVDAHGTTVRQIEEDGFTIAERIDMTLASNTPEGVAKSMGLGLIGFAQCFARVRPDLLVVLGDRPEMLTAAFAALPFTIPVAHIHGGELSLGAIDDAVRHSLTKLSHLHFVSTLEHAGRVRQLGEEPWRVTVSGAPALDRVATFAPWSHAEIERHLQVRTGAPFLLVTFHPATIEAGQATVQCDELLAALDGLSLAIVFTGSNADVGGRAIDARVREFVGQRENAWLVQNAGSDGYFSLMAHAAAMVGNSSSGLIESPSFRLPVVNIGGRQQGRLRARNVIDVGNGRDDIRRGIVKALDPAFRAALSDLENPFGRGDAGLAIAAVLAAVPLGPHLLRKQFVDAGAGTSELVAP